MANLILDGRRTRDLLLPDLIKKIKALAYAPCLAIIQVGNRPDSTSFIRAKKSFARTIGVEEKHIQVAESISQNELLDIINECNADRKVHGIIVQLPLPIHIDRETAIEAINSGKDVDALTSLNVKRWLEGKENAIIPATVRGIRTLLRQYKIGLSGKRVVIVGRSMLVGKPAVSMCLNENSTVTVCHSKTPDLAEHTKDADILIVAAGRPGLIGAGHVNEKQVVIDVGINRMDGRKLDDEIAGMKLIGDVDFDAVSSKVRAITPVPGGVGPMTVFSLFENLLDLCSP